MIAEKPLRVGLAAILVVLLASLVPARAFPQNAEKSEAGLLQIERQWLAAINRHDWTAVENILAPEWTDNSKSGEMLTRSQLFSRPSAPSKINSTVTRRFEEIRARVYGDAGIVTGRLVKRTTAPATGEMRTAETETTLFTDVFVWRGGRWLAVASQETVVPPASMPQRSGAGL